MCDTVEELAATAIEYVPPGQLVHTLEPVTVLYCPTAHVEQRPPFGPVYPASQLQSLNDPLVAGAREFAGHKLQLGLPSGDHCPGAQFRHVSTPTAPELAEYRPTEQFEHAVCPSWLLYVPGAQSRHECLPSKCAYPGSQ